MGYTIDPAIVRVDIFKATGKWYTTIEINMADQYDMDSTTNAVKEALSRTKWKPIDDTSHLAPLFAVCLEPYHKNSFPIVIWLK